MTLGVAFCSAHRAWQLKSHDLQRERNIPKPVKHKDGGANAVGSVEFGVSDHPLK